MRERPVDTAGKEGTERAGTERVMPPGKGASSSARAVKPHSTGAAANMDRKLAGNDRNSSTTSSSQKHLASLSAAMVSQHVSVRVPAHPSCTSRISVEVAHLSSVTPGEVTSSSPATSSSSTTTRAWHRMPTRVLTPHLLGAVANAGTNRPVVPCRTPRTALRRNTTRRLEPPAHDSTPKTRLQGRCRAGRTGSRARPVASRCTRHQGWTARVRLPKSPRRA